MKSWMWGVAGAGGMALLGVVGSWILGTFDKGMEATEAETIRSVMEDLVWKEDDIKRLLKESQTTATGETYGQILISTKEEVIILRTKVETMERALGALTD